MATTPQKPKLIAIVGPTASGKSALAMKIAQEFNGEIITADSRTVYKGMDIGTAKPSKEDQTKVKHWGLDLAEPGQRFTAYQFKKYAEGAVADIQKRGKLPILVGGTGLYVDGVLFDFGFRSDADLRERQELEELTVEKLQEIIKQKGYSMPENKQNKRYLIRTVETGGQASTKKLGLDLGVVLVGLMPPSEGLKQRISKRAEKIFAKGALVETKDLADKHGEEAIARTGGIVYKICLELLYGSINYPEAIERFKKEDWQYARRQKTWFKRNKFIHWFEDPKQAYDFLANTLNTQITIR